MPERAACQPDQCLNGRFGPGAGGGKIVVRGASPRTEERADRRPSSSPNAADPGVGSVAAGSRVTLRACARWKPTRPCSPTSSARSSAGARASRPFSSTARRWRWRSAPAAGDAGAADALAALVAGLGLEDAEVLVRSLTRWFQLVNLAEDNERIRRLIARERRDPDLPLPGSLADAVQRLAGVGVQAGELDALLGDVDLRLVLTAHPTEARGAHVEKLGRVFAVLRDLDEREGPPGAMAVARRRLLGTVQELWGSDELRAVSPTVADEVRSGLVYFLSTLASVLPEIYRDLEEAIASAYPGTTMRVPPFLTFGSWIGGDRDGNPFVTPDVTLARARPHAPSSAWACTSGA